MKWNIKRITGVISFICALGWLYFGISLTIKDIGQLDTIEIFALISMFFTGFSTILYVTLTKFGITDLKEIDKITTENQILRLQIEQKELKKKLTIE